MAVTLAPIILDGRVSKIEHVFPVRNTTTKPLRFEKVQPSCGCSQAVLSEEVLSPGQEASLRVGVDLRGRIGAQSFACVLVEEDGTRWQFVLKVMLYPVAAFSKEPGIHFGNVPHDGPAELDLEYREYAAEQGAFRPGLTVRSSNPAVSVALGEPRIEKTSDDVFERKVPVLLTLRGKREFGAGYATLTAKAEGDGGMPGHSVGLDWYVRPLVSTQPHQVLFRLDGEKVVGESEPGILVTRKDGKPFEIDTVTLPHPCLTWRVEPVDANSARVLFQLSPEKRQDFLVGEAAIALRGGGIPAVRIPVAVVVK